MTLFFVIFAAYALVVFAVVAYAAWLYCLPRRARRQVDALEAAWALTADEPGRP